MAMLIAIELMTLMFAISTLSSVRTLVGAEGLWSKAQRCQGGKIAISSVVNKGTCFTLVFDAKVVLPQLLPV